MNLEQMETVTEAPFDETGEVEDPRDLHPDALGEFADDPGDPLMEVTI